MAVFHMLALRKDESVLPAIHAYLADKKWKRGLIFCGAGSLYDVVLSNPKSRTPGQPLAMVRLEGPCEITSFCGEIIPRDEIPAGLERHLHEDDPSPYLVHIHGSVSYGECEVSGGGFREGKVSRAVNLYIWEIDDPI